MTTDWEALLSAAGRNLRGSAVRELFKVLQRPGMVSFAGGMPAPETFPCAEVAEACAAVLREHGAIALQYGQTEGYDPLREYIAEVVMAQMGVHARRENVLITTGSLQVADLLPKVLLDPGEPMVVEAPTFLGALASFSPYRPRYISVPLDGHGMQVDRLERVLAGGERPKFVYAIPNFHNPAGCTMALERRQQLVALADRYGVPILEDDPYGALRFDGEPLPPLIQLDQEQMGIQPASQAYTRGNVLYAGSFSKILSPGIRLGWVVGPVPIIARLARAKQGTDLHTSLLVQMIAYRLSVQGFFPAHIARIRELYRRRRDIMLEMLREHFPPEAHWTVPDGGLFLWVTLPEGCDTQAMLADAVEQGVAFVPGPAFYVEGGGRNQMRLNFSCASEEQLREGMARLGAIVREHLRRSG
ncbi:MAG: PLP-dependent aminotransferase family protein [Chloroflexia bacterium]